MPIRHEVFDAAPRAKWYETSYFTEGSFAYTDMIESQDALAHERSTFRYKIRPIFHAYKFHVSIALINSAGVRSVFTNCSATVLSSSS